jgi:hypothetical protein
MAAVEPVDIIESTMAGRGDSTKGWIRRAN